MKWGVQCSAHQTNLGGFMRQVDLENFELASGSHTAFEKGACIMEMVSYLADEPWSDHPQCACPILTRVAIQLNDTFKPPHRQLLKPLIPLLLNSLGSEETRIARKRLIYWRNVSALYPVILDVLKLDALASQLRAFKNTLPDMALASSLLKSNEALLKKTHNAYAYAYTYAYTYADADAYAYTYADAYVYAYVDTYAYAFRDQVAQIAIETLRLACLIQDVK